MWRFFGSGLYRLRKRVLGAPPPSVAVLRLQGVIGAGGRFRRGLSLETVAEDIDAAFALHGLGAVALIINSPGGAVVQSARIMERIRTSAREKNVPVLAFAEDIAASGGYMLALAGDEIFVHEASLIGSIGVIASGFGFQQLLDKAGIERRVYTAGEKKSMLDPFKPEAEQDIVRLQELMDEAHDYFKSLVRRRRGKRLEEGQGQIFSGDIFSGREAVKLGLVDDIGEMRAVVRARFGDKVRFRPIGKGKKGLLSYIGMKQSEKVNREAQIAQEAVEQILHGIEERSMWSGYGL